MAQARELAGLIASAGGRPPAIVAIKTTGDMVLDRPLAEAGGKGLFTKELDAALLRGDVDITVHSAKDLPTWLPDGMTIFGCLPREDVRDAWISPRAAHPRDLAMGATVGSASLRRAAMLKRLRPDLVVTLLRGNVETRLHKVASGQVDATLLAYAGLKRLGLAAQATTVLETDEFLPAAGQGAIVITGRAADAASLAVVAPILHRETGVALAAERAFLRVLEGSCRTPIGAHAQLAGGRLSLRGIVLRPDGSRVFEAAVEGAEAEAERLGEAAARDILGRAPPDFLAA